MCYYAKENLHTISVTVMIIGYFRPQDAARALKKLITNNVGKSNIAIMYTLTVSAVLCSASTEDCRNTLVIMPSLINKGYK